MTADRNADSPLFGDLLRQHRLAAILTQEELAERAGMSIRGISDLERGARTHPHRETVRLLADALGLTGEARSTFFQAAPRIVGRTASRSDQAKAPAQFPVPLTPLIGRGQERAALDALMRHDAARLVTLTGPGGVGKTRLAIAAAEQVADAFADGRYFVDLAPLHDPSLLLPHVAATLGLREPAGKAVANVVHEYLREREVLLVLDNFEHVLPAAPVVAELLAAAPRVQVLATSRAPLRVRGEREYPVPVMRLPTAEDARDLTALAAIEAVAFFVDRARAVQPDFTLTADNAAAELEICQQLDALPLALELAAARVKVLPPQTLRARLGARLPLLTDGARDAPERQRTLRDAVAGSYELLDPDARVLFHRLGIFVGGWTLEAAEYVGGETGDRSNSSSSSPLSVATPPKAKPSPPSVLEGLASLGDLSLIRVDQSGPEPRYGMLETIREFARERLADSGEEALLRQAHAAYFLGLAEQGKAHLYGGAGQRDWLQRLEIEHPNFRAALDTLAANDDGAYLRLAANLSAFWWMRSHLVEGQAHLERALTNAVAATPHRAEALLGLGRIVTSQGDLAAGERWLRQSEELARALSLPAILLQAIYEHGVVAEWGGDDERSIPLYESALAVARASDDAQGASNSLLALSDIAYRRGDLATAERLCEEAIALLRAVGDEFMLNLCLVTSGAVALALGDLPRAIASYREALDLALGIEMDWATASTLAGFAAVAAHRGDHVAAAQLLGACETMREASHHYRIANVHQHAQTTLAVRSALGDEAFAEAWAAGRALPAEVAADLPQALEQYAEREP
jgi:predicted ATPase/transcriptional regulator with XRE-family HTH domain